MLKEFVDKLLSLRDVEKIEINGATYTNKNIVPVKDCYPDELNTNTLSSIVEFIKKSEDVETLGLNQVFVHVKGPKEVSLISASMGVFKERVDLILAKPIIPEFEFGRFIDREQFNIALQSKFIQTEERDLLLQLISTMETDEGVSQADNGISQKVVAKKGVALKGEVVIPNPIALKPYRTFVEVEQPESLFIFRVDDNMRCALFEADGGAWRIEAVDNLASYFEDCFKEEIKKNFVSIIK